MSDAQTAFSRLHPSVQQVLAANFGWQALRPVQEASIPPILNGSTVVVTAPTAGGKTEAAVLPLLSKILDERWMPTSILYLAPLRALLNDLGERLGELCDHLGLRAAVWHGDVGQRERRRIAASPPDILLTTPESLEVLLSMASGERHALLLGLRAVVVDEAHAFYGIDRGTQLLSLLERLQRSVDRDVQRIALSATIGNPADLATWLRGSSARDIADVRIARSQAHRPVFSVSYRESIAGVVQEVLAYQHEKIITFCRTRSDAEELAHALVQAGHTAWAHHSALSKENRAVAEREFRSAGAGALVATSTLELGIDIGDLDRVVQVDAPTTVASLLQRLGRTGRRGAVAKMSFIATNPEQLLLTLGLLALHAEGWVEPLMPSWQPYPVLVQQMLSTVLQMEGIGRGSLIEHFAANAAFSQIPRGRIALLVDHLISETTLTSIDGTLSFGAGGERAFGYRRFMDLISVFSGPDSVVVRSGQLEVGTLDRWFIEEMIARDRSTFLLNGRAWNVERWPFEDAVLDVVPAPTAEAPLFIGSGLVLSFDVMRSIRRILSEDSEPTLASFANAEISDVAGRLFSQAREVARAQRLDRASSPLISDGGMWQLFTYGGLRANRLIADLVYEPLGLSPTVTNAGIRVKAKDFVATTFRERFAAQACSNIAEEVLRLPTVPSTSAKFIELLDDGSRRSFAQERAYDVASSEIIFADGSHLA